MPVMPKKSPNIIQNGTAAAGGIPDKLRPYTSLGVQLTVRGSHGVGVCPFCQREKFSADVMTGLWRCLVCGTGTDNGGGNALVFLRLLWRHSMDATQEPVLRQLADERGYLYTDTLRAWGVCQSVIDGKWIIPGYGIDGDLDQLYRRTLMPDKGKWVWKLLPTPGVWPDGRSHALHAPEQVGQYRLDADKSVRYVFEGPWDGMAFWEVARSCKRTTDGTLDFTGDDATSLIGDATVLAFPGCGTFRDDWVPIFRGRDVVFPFDSDHPREIGGKVFRAGMDGAHRAARKLDRIARSVSWVRWGPDGYDPDRPSGWDVRDHLRSMDDGHNGRERYLALDDLLGKIEPVPTDWAAPATINGHAHHGPEIESEQCDKWLTLEEAWKEAQEWRQAGKEVLSVMLAVATSTLQGGNQLFLQVIGSASGGKTTFCEGLLVSRSCHSLEHLTGFHSGWKKPTGEGDEKDCSLIARINGKTLITPEGDVMMSNPRFAEIMSQQRRIFDGKSGATYKNSDEDKLWVGLRTPWIIAGTPALMDVDQSRLGDRFIRIIMADPTEEEKRRISRKAFDTEMMAMLETSNGTAGSVIDPKMRKAHALTGGYVDWLRANAEALLPTIEIPDWARDRCIDLASLTADMRARPNPDHRKIESNDNKEMPFRITRQLGRLARCLAVVWNKKVVDREVMNCVRKVAFDTAHGKTLDIVNWFQGFDPRTSARYQTTGIMPGQLAVWAGWKEDKLVEYMLFLRKIDVVTYTAQTGTKGYWRLTERVNDLFVNVMKD